MAGMNVVDKNILDVITKNKSRNPVEITQIKIKPVEKTPPKKMITDRVKEVVIIPKITKITKIKSKTMAKKKIITKIVSKKDTSVKHVKESIKHVKELKKHVHALSGQIRKKEATAQKQMQEQKQQLSQVQQDVLETKSHYQHIPKLSLETQMLIESMGKLSAVVKQLLVLFNQKISNEEGPLFAKLDELAEQNEKIAEGILAVADLVKEKEIPKAQIREFNPYVPQRPQPMQVREQMQTPQQTPQIPQDLGRFQFPGAEQQQGEMQQIPAQEQMQPIPQYSAPLPLFSQSPQPELVPSRKRMLF